MHVLNFRLMLCTSIPNKYMSNGYIYETLMISLVLKYPHRETQYKLCVVQWAESLYAWF